MYFSLYQYSPAQYLAYAPLSRIVAKWLMRALRPRLDVAVNDGAKTFNVHCHLLVEGSDQQQKQRYFRQRLLMLPALCRRYEYLKQQLVNSGVIEHQHYGQVKSDFVKLTLAELESHLWSHTKQRIMP